MVKLLASVNGTFFVILEIIYTNVHTIDFGSNQVTNNPNNLALTERIEKKETKVGLLNPFHSTGMSVYPLLPTKISKTPCFQRSRKRPKTWSGVEVTIL